MQSIFAKNQKEITCDKIIIEIENIIFLISKGKEVLHYDEWHKWDAD